MEKDVGTEPKVVAESLPYYLPAFDGLRFLAFLLVLVHHILPTPPNAAIPFIQEHGWIGVELFFAISSYLLFFLLKAEDAATGNINIPNFYVRRLLRLYPLMMAFPTAMLLIYGLKTPDAVGRLLGIAFFSDNFLTWTAWITQFPFSEHLWTLSYEFQIYLVIPLAFVVYKVIGARRFLWLLLALWVIACGARLAFILSGAKHPVIWVTPFLRPESTCLGIVLSLGVLARAQPALIVLVGVAAIIAFTQIPNVFQVDLWTLALYPIAAAISGSVLWLAVNVESVSHILSQQWIVFLGKISFGLYVF